MRVLDVGSAAGDVAFLAASLVADSGEVVGVDRVPAALDLARARATARSLRNVSFREGDPGEMAFDRRFDAVIGRYVLQFQQDPATAADVGLETLFDRMSNEASASSSVFVGHFQIGAWARV